MSVKRLVPDIAIGVFAGSVLALVVGVPWQWSLVTVLLTIVFLPFVARLIPQEQTSDDDDRDRTRANPHNATHYDEHGRLVGPRIKDSAEKSVPPPGPGAASPPRRTS